MSSDTNLLVFDQIDYVFIRQWYLCLFSSFPCSFLSSFLQACNVNLASFLYLFRSINMTRYLMSWLEQKYKYSVYTRLWTMMKDKAWLICSSQQDELNRKGTNWVHLSCTHHIFPCSYSVYSYPTYNHSWAIVKDLAALPIWPSRNRRPYWGTFDSWQHGKSFHLNMEQQREDR